LRFDSFVEERSLDNVVDVEELASSPTRFDFSENRDAIHTFLTSQQTPNFLKFESLSIAIDWKDYRGLYNPAASSRAR